MATKYFPAPEITNYLEWHYGQIPQTIIKTSRNFFTFLYHYFAVGFLLKTLLAPWKRQIVTKKSPGFNLQEVFEILTFNLISRVIGAIARFFLIFGWLISNIILMIASLIIFLIWLLIPGLTYPLFLMTGQQTQWKKHLIYPDIPHPQDYLDQLTHTALGKFIFARLNIPFEKHKEITITKKESEEFLIDFAKFRHQQGLNTTLLTPDVILPYMFKKFKPLKNFLKKYQVKTKDAIAVTNWFLRHEKMTSETRAWQVGNLLKIPPLGKSLVYGYTPSLNNYCEDLAAPKEYHHQLVGRSRETAMIEQVLSRTVGNNVLLVGEPGVGRLTIVEEFAKKVHDGTVNPSLSHRRVLEFSLRRLLSESKSDLEAKGVVEEILGEAAYAGNIILAIANFDQYVSSGQGRIDLTNVFNRAVMRGVQIIGITSFTDYAKYLYPNQELLKNFEKVEAEPPTKEEALTILEDTVDLYERRNAVFVTYQALKEIIKKVDRYVSHIPFPEKAIDLLDEACVYAAQNQIRLVTPEEINVVISQKTKIPLGKISEDEVEKLKNLESLIHRRVIDQQEAVLAVSRALRRTRVGITKENKPVGTFLFMGPTGVGKTETAKALAEAYFGDEKRMIRFDMSEYQGDDALERAIGSPQTGDPGLFSKAIREDPFSLLLLDEIEKSHPNVLNLYLTMLDEGYFTDAFGKRVDCRNLIIIGTSNAGTELIRQRIDEGINIEDINREALDYVQRQGIFTPEFLNRFDAAVIFRPLSMDHLLQIAELMLKNLNKRLAPKEIAVKITPDLLKRIAELGYNPAFGARPMNRVIQDKIEDHLAQKLLRGELKKGEEIEVKI